MILFLLNEGANYKASRDSLNSNFGLSNPNKSFCFRIGV